MIRPLSTQEIQTISGANLCAGNNLSTEMWKRMHADAQREAAASGIFSGVVLGGAALYFGAPVMATAFVSTIVAGAVYQYDYEHYEFWPWNF